MKYQEPEFKIIYTIVQNVLFESGPASNWDPEDDNVIIGW